MYSKLVRSLCEDTQDPKTSKFLIVSIVPSDWIKAAFKIKKGNEQQEKRFWCSALVAYVYVQLGLLPDDTSWTVIAPGMLGTENPKNEVSFQNCTLDKEKQIK